MESKVVSPPQLYVHGKTNIYIFFSLKFKFRNLVDITHIPTGKYHLSSEQWLSACLLVRPILIATPIV